MSKFTIEHFRATYPNDAICLDKIFQTRYGDLKICPSCGKETQWRRITTRRAYQCRMCYFQLYPTAGTVFEKTTTPLTYWFYVLYLFTVTRNGVAAKEIERQLGVTYKTAWRMGHQIRKLMKKNKGKLKGFVEVDETYMKTKETDTKPKTGRDTENKTPVLGMVERLGTVKAIALPDATKKSIFPQIEQHIDKSATVFTDDYLTYKRLSDDLGYRHGVINHSMKRYRWEDISTNTIEGFFSQLKRTIGGSHIWVSGKYLQNYLDECCFRYDNRNIGNMMFGVILDNMKKEWI